EQKERYLTDEGIKYISEELRINKEILETCKEEDLKNIQFKIKIYKELLEGLTVPETDDFET
ncbi:MAG: hypothetical protein ACI4IU_04830, partial [Candidatus Limousia pullorum]